MITFQIVSLFTQDLKMSKFRFKNLITLSSLPHQISCHVLLSQIQASKIKLPLLYCIFICLIGQFSKHFIKLSIFPPWKWNCLPLDAALTKLSVFQTSKKSSSLPIHCMLQEGFSTCYPILTSYILLPYCANLESSSKKTSITASNSGIVLVKKTGIFIWQLTESPRALCQQCAS